MSEKIRVALADDHKLVRSGISMILNDHPDIVVVQQAADGQALLDGLSEAAPDIILLDLEMPVMGGKETLMEIRKLNTDRKVLMLTMHNNKALMLQMMEIGANGYLLKDTDPKEVVEAVLKVNEVGYYFSDRLSMAMLQGISNPSLKNAAQFPGHDLTAREVEVLQLICQELTTTEIGERLFLSPKTIEGYRKVLMEKTSARNMAGLVLFAVKNKLIAFE